MAIRARRGGGNGLEAWPGYVDALSTLLMGVAVVFLIVKTILLIRRKRAKLVA